MSTAYSVPLQRSLTGPMGEFLGIDTSNYTTSAALLQGGEILQKKKLLPVRAGELGLRQSDAVFHHVTGLPEVLESLPGALKISAVGASDRPRDLPGSYMPCFSVGAGTAGSLAHILGVPFFAFSHQDGHIAAVLYSAKRLDLLEKPFLAFHVSGGTTEAILVEPGGERVLRTKLLAGSLDLKGGQAVDRVGAMLGLPFPSGKALEELAGKTDVQFRIKPSMKGANCSLSGIENKCKAMLLAGQSREEIASFCIQSVLAALDGMASALILQYGELPMVFAGGVSSNGMIRNALSQKYGALFASPEFSSDNAAGIAVLTAAKAGAEI